MENSKQYLIQFIASMQGDKLTVKQLHSIESQTKKMTKSMGGATKATKSMGNSMMSLAKRALMVAPIWMLIRGAIMMVTSTVKEAIQANIAFQENMARIKTVVTASSDSVEQDMTQMRTAILRMATKSRFSLGELAEGMYFLRTAGLTTEEAIGAFASTVATATGTTNSLKDTTRIVVGIYNTMGKTLDDNLSVHEKFQKINDALTYTYATQEVQLQELGQSYLQFAPYLSGLSDDFIDMITMLGFLNTKMLKAGRAGRMTGMAILQLSKKTQQLAEIFGITFDPDKPINFLDTLKQIVSALKDTEKLTKGQSEAVAKLFEARAGVPFRILIDNYKEFIEVIERARKESEGFAETMQDIMMHTYTAQMERLKNIIAVSANEFFSAASGTGDFVESLKMINDVLEENIKNIRTIGEVIGFLTSRFAAFDVAIQDMNPEAIQRKIFADAFGPIGSLVVGLTWGEPMGEAFSEYTQGINEAKKKTESYAAFQKNMREADINFAKKQQIEEKKIVELLKLKGYSEADIIEHKIKNLLLSEDSIDPLQKEIKLSELRNDLLVAQMKIRNQIVTTYQSAQVNLLKAQGASELQIINAQLLQLQNQKGIIGDSLYLTKLTDIRIRQAMELANLKQKELQTQTSIALQYEKADKFQRPRIRRAVELRGMGEGQLMTRFRGDEYDKSIILDYWNYFTEKQQEAFGKILSKDYGIDFKMLDLEDKLTPEMKKILLNTNDLEQYWKNWSTFGKQEIADLSAYYKKVLFGISAPGEQPTSKELEPLMPHMTMDLKHELLLNFKVDEESLENIPETIGKAVEELLTKEEFVTKLSRRLREII